MNSKIGFNVLLIGLLVFGCEQARKPVVDKDRKNSSGLIQSIYLIEAQDLKQILDASSYPVALIDFRKSQQYQEGHIVGAQQLWRAHITSQNYGYDGMMASREEMAKVLGSQGITAGHKIIIYDDNGSVDAARLWWVLWQYGHRNVALVNGGLSAWKQSGFSVTVAVPPKEPVAYSFPHDEDRSRLATWDQVLAGLNQENIIILDTRTLNEYSGYNKKTGASHAGRIPGSLWIDWAETVDLGGTNKFKSLELLKSLYRDKGVTPEKTVIVYCHSGVRSAHTTFVLSELLHYPRVLNYDGSWTEWSHSNLPMEKDSVVIK